MGRMGDLDLEPIKAVEAAATPGPWFDLYGDDPACPDDYRAYMIRSAAHTESEALIQASRFNGAPWCLAEDRRFITHARTNVPVLVAEVERLRAERDAAEEESRVLRDELAALVDACECGKTMAAVAHAQEVLDRPRSAHAKTAEAMARVCAAAARMQPWLYSASRVAIEARRALGATLDALAEAKRAAQKGGE